MSTYQLAIDPFVADWYASDNIGLGAGACACVAECTTAERNSFCRGGGTPDPSWNPLGLTRVFAIFSQLQGRVPETTQTLPRLLFTREFFWIWDTSVMTISLEQAGIPDFFVATPSRRPVRILAAASQRKSTAIHSAHSI